MLTPDFLQPDLILSLKSFAYFESLLPVVDFAPLDLLFSPRSLGYSGPFTSIFGRANLGIPISAMEVLIAEEILSVRTMKCFSSTVFAVESFTLDPTAFLRAFARVEPLMFSSGAGYSAPLSPALATLPFESSPFFKSLLYFEPSVLTTGSCKLELTMPPLDLCGVGFFALLRSFGRSDPLTSATDSASPGLASFARDPHRLGLLLLAMQTIYLAFSLFVFDTTFIGSSLSLRSGRAGPTTSLFGVARLAVLLFLPDFQQSDFIMLSRSPAHAGPPPLALEHTASGSFPLLQESFRLDMPLLLCGLVWSELPLLVFDLLQPGLPSSIRSCRLDLAFFPFAVAQTDPPVFVPDEERSGSSVLLRSMMCFGSFLSTHAIMRPGFLTSILTASLSDLSMSLQSLSCMELFLTVPSASRLGLITSLLDSCDSDFLPPLQSFSWTLSCT